MWAPWRFSCRLASLLLLIPTVVLGFAASPERTVVLLLHKPPNVVTSHVSDNDRSTVYDHVQDMNAYVGENGSFEEVTNIQSKLHAIGRLDADTTGLLLLTNDGGLVHHVTNKNAASLQGTITKTYHALVMGHHTEETLSCFWEGVDIGAKYGGMTLPVDHLKILEHPNHKSTLVEISISEGKNRQVRRMFHSIGSGVMQLKRVAVGNGVSKLTLEGLQQGQWRILSDEEVRRALQWEPKVLEEKPVGRGQGGSGSLNGKSGSGPKGERSSASASDQPKGRRQGPSGKKRRNNDSKSAYDNRTRRR